LVSRWPAIFMLFARGALFLLRTTLVTLLPWSPENGAIYNSMWLTVLSFKALLFTISIAFILLAMAKERTKLRHRTAAMIDPLTGIANRRAFVQDEAQLAKRHTGDLRPTAVLLIDLDHFKSINERIGHALSDRVLAIFTNSARQSESFAKAAQDVDSRPVGATVSIGLVHSDAPMREMPELLAQADQALYFVKERGRNRVEVATLDMIVERKNDAATTGATSIATVATKAIAKSAA